MRRIFIGSSLLLFAVACSPRVAPTGGSVVGGGVAGPNVILYGRGIYPGDDPTYEMIRTSGFTTLMLSSFYIRANGDVVSGDDGLHPIIHQGEFTGSEDWLRRVQSLRKGGGPVKRIEILLEGRWYNQPPNTFDHIRDGTVSGSMLDKILRIMKEKIGVDAICIDDESVYDSPSIIRLGEMAHRIGLHMTLCPFTKIPFWKEVIDSSRDRVVDAVYLQCYDGGKHNTPGPWVQGLHSDIPVYPLFLCRGAFSTCGTSHGSKTPDEIKADMRVFKKEYPGMQGAGVWQMADIKDYVRMNCAVRDTASGNATTVRQYLGQLKESLSEGL